jgi:hypothetical protein
VKDGISSTEIVVNERCHHRSSRSRFYDRVNKHLCCFDALKIFSCEKPFARNG